jgi:hypothetical protein
LGYWDFDTRNFEELSRVATLAEKNIIFLHPPKTGGSSIMSAARISPNWLAVRASEKAPPAGELPPFGDTVGLGSPDGHGGQPSIMFHVGHKRYETAELLLKTLQERRAASCRMFMTVRPVKSRLISMFRDYWRQVELSEVQTGEERLRGKRRVYVEDSRHYVDKDGEINGRAWFSAFAEHGAGIPFFMSEMFDDTSQIVQAVESKQLEIVPTSDITAFYDGIGLVNPGRKRESSLQKLKPVLKAIAEAEPIIDELALRDAEFDRKLEELVGPSLFSPK